MSESSNEQKSTDSRNRILCVGEYHRANGRYCFRHSDADGNPKEDTPVRITVA